MRCFFISSVYLNVYKYFSYVLQGQGTSLSYWLMARRAEYKVCACMRVCVCVRECSSCTTENEALVYLSLHTGGRVVQDSGDSVQAQLCHSPTEGI